MKNKVFIGVFLGIIALLIIIAVVVSFTEKENEDGNLPVTEAPCDHVGENILATIEGVAPTCQSTGLSEGKKCKHCGAIVVEQTELPFGDCVPGEWIVDYEATKTEEGKRHNECTICGNVVVEELIHPIGSSGLKFELDFSGEYTVYVGSATDVDIVIPAMYNGKPVTAIGESAFNGCTFIKSITIPNSIKTIGTCAFAYCSSLTSLNIPVSVTNIGNLVVSNDLKLTSIMFEGTKEQWDAITKASLWDINWAAKKIVCTDTTIN